MFWQAFGLSFIFFSSSSWAARMSVSSGLHVNEVITDDGQTISARHQAETPVEDGSGDGTTTIDLLQDRDALQEALEHSLEAIMFERSLLCPTAEGFRNIRGLKQYVDCCSIAIKTIDANGNVETTLKFVLGKGGDAQATTVRLNAENFREIDPPPCGGANSNHELEDDYNALAPDSQTVVDAKAAVEEELRSLCPGLLARPEVKTGAAGGNLVTAVHAAEVQIVAGMNVKIVVELTGGTFHLYEVAFDANGKVSEVLHPNVNDPCSLFGKNTLDAGAMDEISVISRQMSQSTSVGTSVLSRRARYFRRAGGHDEQLDKQVPLYSLEELEVIANRTSAESYDLRTAYPKCFPSNIVQNQGSCGSCWAMAAVGAIGDRHCIANPASMIDKQTGRRWLLSTQQVLSCGSNRGCTGGHGHQLFSSMVSGKLKLTYNKDYPYAVRCWKDIKGITQQWGNYGCNFYAHTPDADPNKPCKCVATRVKKMPACQAQKHSAGAFGVSTYKRIPSPGTMKSLWGGRVWSIAEVVKLIQNSIYQAGSVYCSFKVHEDFYPWFTTYGADAVYRYQSGRWTGSHAVAMLGWGVMPNTNQYWTLRNSWGTQWGRQGHYKHIRGYNDCNIESDVSVPEVAAVKKKNSLEFATAEASIVRKSGATWLQLDIACSVDCLPISASLPKVPMNNMVHQELSTKCCCDDIHYTPGRCVWVPHDQLHSHGWVVSLFKERSCGTYDLGRGLVVTKEHQGDSQKACKNAVLGQLSSNSNSVTNESAGMVVEVKNKGPTKLRVKVDFSNIANLKGDLQVSLKAKLNPKLGTAIAEQLYIVDIGSHKSGKVSAKKLFQLSSVERVFDRRDESYPIKTYWGTEWRVREIYVLKITATCSSECQGSAKFEGLDTTYHPKGEDALNLKETKTEDPKTLMWTAVIQDYPTGETKVTVSAKQVKANQEDGVSQTFPVDIPFVSDDQGGEFYSLGIVSISWQVQEKANNYYETGYGGGYGRYIGGGLQVRGGNSTRYGGWQYNTYQPYYPPKKSIKYYQVFSAVCSRTCSLKSFEIGAKVLHWKQLSKQGDRRLRVSLPFKLKHGDSERTARICARDPNLVSSEDACRSAKFKFGTSGVERFSLNKEETTTMTTITITTPKPVEKPAVKPIAKPTTTTTTTSKVIIASQNEYKKGDRVMLKAQQAFLSAGAKGKVYSPLQTSSHTVKVLFDSGHLLKLDIDKLERVDEATPNPQVASALPRHAKVKLHKLVKEPKCSFSYAVVARATLSGASYLVYVKTGPCKNRYLTVPAEKITLLGKGEDNSNTEADELAQFKQKFKKGNEFKVVGHYIQSYNGRKVVSQGILLNGAGPYPKEDMPIHVRFSDDRTERHIQPKHLVPWVEGTDVDPEASQKIKPAKQSMDISQFKEGVKVKVDGISSLMVGKMYNGQTGVSLGPSPALKDRVIVQFPDGGKLYLEAKHLTLLEEPGTNLSKFQKGVKVKVDGLVSRIGQKYNGQTGVFFGPAPKNTMEEQNTVIVQFSDGVKLALEAKNLTILENEISSAPIKRPTPAPRRPKKISQKPTPAPRRPHKP